MFIKLLKITICCKTYYLGYSCRYSYVGYFVYCICMQESKNVFNTDGYINPDVFTDTDSSCYKEEDLQELFEMLEADSYLMLNDACTGTE